VSKTYRHDQEFNMNDDNDMLPTDYSIQAFVVRSDTKYVDLDAEITCDEYFTFDEDDAWEVLQNFAGGYGVDLGGDQFGFTVQGRGALIETWSYYIEEIAIWGNRR
jgi:hypothetical protein